MLSVNRVKSIDLVRGAVMVLMAIDHVRVYSGLPAGGPTAGLFFTRWVTHFCAPAFVFFAGTSAFLHGQKLGDPGAPLDPARGRLSRYLVTRGALLVLLELTVIRVAWSFSVNFTDFILAGVIWMLGWCMMLLALLVRLRTKTIGLIGLGLMLFQQVFRFVPLALPASIRDSVGWVWEFVYPAGLQPPDAVNILYVLVPWIGVMAAGYAFGAILGRDPAARRRFCLSAGLTATALYLALVVAFVFFAPDQDAGASGRRLFAALSPPKYPASQPFLLMTLGPTIALLPFLERAGGPSTGLRAGRIAGMLTTFGRVPLFYYLLHIPVIHIAALVVTRVREGSVHPEWYLRAPYTSVPDGHHWSLSLLYVVFVIVVAVLYVACRWYAGVKARRPDSWLRYI